MKLGVVETFQWNVCTGGAEARSYYSPLSSLSPCPPSPPLPPPPHQGGGFFMLLCFLCFYIDR
jgi:hypothetical protein